MFNLPQINKKIKSIGVTSRITRALEIISTTHHHAYRELQSQSLPYFQGIYNIFYELMTDPEHDIRETNNRFLSFDTEKKELWIVIGSDIGMCGDINDRVMKHLQSSFRPKTDALVVVGKRLASHLSSGFGDKIMIAMSSEMRPKDSRNNLRDIVKNVFDTFMNENYQRLSILYVKDHKSGTLDKVTVLPFREDYFEGRKKVFVKTWDHKMSYPNAIFDLFPQYLECIFLSAVINSKLGEHSVRREMMHNATKNATELLDGYKLLFNKMRQSSITQEITEIVVASKFKKKK